jgi:hypothetical protein
MKKAIILLLILFYSKNLNAQDVLKINDHKVNIKAPYKKFILPLTLIAVGAILKTSSIQNEVQEESREFFGKDFHYTADDYFQFVPEAQLYLGNAFGFESKDGYKQMITNDIISKAIVTGVVFVTKNSTHQLRPDDTGYKSFPSGHTALAFNNATLLFLQYKDSNLLYASSGYLFATATGVLRVANNRHWSGDVLVGAGVGIAVATLVHSWHPFNFDKKTKEATLIGYPVINNSSYGIGLLYQIK